MNQQRQLPLAVAATTKLVTVETARAALGVDVASVDRMIDEGVVVAFDISTHASRNREIRVWIQSLQGTSSPSVDAVVSDVVGDAAELRAPDVTARLCCDLNTIHRLLGAGHLRGDMRRAGKSRALWIYASSLTHFLRSRVLGAV